LFVPGMVILNPSCVAKTFPDFWAKIAAPMPEGCGAVLRDPSTGRVLPLPEQRVETRASQGGVGRVR
jgi:hypothetical protein